MTQPTKPDQAQLLQAVRDRYAASARRVTQEHVCAEDALPVLEPAGCCGDSACGTSGEPSPITADLYAVDEVADLPASALLASLGCGNPTALAEDMTYRRLLAEAGFVDVSVEVTRAYDARQSCGDGCSPSAKAEATAFGTLDAAGGRFVAFVPASKPARCQSVLHPFGARAVSMDETPQWTGGRL